MRADTVPPDPAADLLAEIVAPAGSGRPVADPATLEIIGHAPTSTAEEVDEAVQRATAAQAQWSLLSDAARRDTLHRAAEAVEAESEGLAHLLTAEQGKPLQGPGARFEVATAIAWVHATADLPHPDYQISGVATVAYEPLGVVAAITPWNWPVMISSWQLSGALRMGNAVISKPSEYTPLSGLAFARLLNRVLPPGLLETISGDGEVGDRLVRHEGVAKIMFTGSVETGQKIVAASASNLARLTLELGGNDPGIVLPGADPDEVAAPIFWGAFANSGQTCAAIKRLYVHESQVNVLADAIVAAASDVRMGHGRDESTLLGPVQNEPQRDKVHGLARQALTEGARAIPLGTFDASLPGYFHPATLLLDVPHSAAIVQEEQFGPVLPIVAYRTIEEVIEMANDSPVGLGASVWGPADEAEQIARRLEAGTVWVNAHGSVTPDVPFGGIKKSGYGLEFGIDGLKAVARSKVLVVPAASPGPHTANPSS